MAKSRGVDMLTVLRGLNAVSKAAANVTEAELKEAWMNSSIRSGLKTVLIKNYVPENLPKQLSEATGRSLAVANGLAKFSVIAAQRFVNHDLSSYMSKPQHESQQSTETISDSYSQQGISCLNNKSVFNY